MSYVNTTRTASNGILDRLLLARTKFATALRQRRVYAQTVRELSNLNDRELADLGISRLSIHDVAREAAFGE
jgi:uncharacterized protein YjiS (DUF1127 family)